MHLHDPFDAAGRYYRPYIFDGFLTTVGNIRETPPRRDMGHFRRLPNALFYYDSLRQ